jgi:hypothetical protein
VREPTLRARCQADSVGCSRAFQLLPSPPNTFPLTAQDRVCRPERFLLLCDHLLAGRVHDALRRVMSGRLKLHDLRRLSRAGTASASMSARADGGGAICAVGQHQSLRLTPPALSPPPRPRQLERVDICFLRFSIGDSVHHESAARSGVELRGVLSRECLSSPAGREPAVREGATCSASAGSSAAQQRNGSILAHDSRSG